MLSKLFSAKTDRQPIEWRELKDVSALEELDSTSHEQPVMIFKHSTRCGISSMVLNKFEREFEQGSHFVTYFLDLIACRDVSNEIEKRYEVQHQSPQVLLISRGKAIYDASHTGITYAEVKKNASAALDD